MNNRFFIGDLHFGHKGIISFLRTKFSCVKEMNNTLVERWNSVVNARDVVYVLGDVAFSKEDLKKIKECRGNKHLVLGNHDKLGTQEYLKYFNKLHGAYKYKEGIIMTHVPIHPSQLEYRWSWNVHGHIHEPDKYNLEGNYVNVNADVLDNYTPISWDELTEERNTITKNRLRRRVLGKEIDSCRN